MAGYAVMSKALSSRTHEEPPAQSTLLARVAAPPLNSAASRTRRRPRSTASELDATGWFPLSLLPPRTATKNNLLPQESKHASAENEQIVQDPTLATPCKVAKTDGETERRARKRRATRSGVVLVY